MFLKILGGGLKPLQAPHLRQCPKQVKIYKAKAPVQAAKIQFIKLISYMLAIAEKITILSKRFNYITWHSKIVSVNFVTRLVTL